MAGEHAAACPSRTAAGQGRSSACLAVITGSRGVAARVERWPLSLAGGRSFCADSLSDFCSFLCASGTKGQGSKGTTARWWRSRLAQRVLQQSAEKMAQQRTKLRGELVTEEQEPGPDHGVCPDSQFRCMRALRRQMGLRPLGHIICSLLSLET